MIFILINKLLRLLLHVLQQIFKALFYVWNFSIPDLFPYYQFPEILGIAFQRLYIIVSTIYKKTNSRDLGIIGGLTDFFDICFNALDILLKNEETAIVERAAIYSHQINNIFVL